MGSLAHCLKKHNVSPELEREIRDRAAELRAEGYTAQQASEQAVKDRLDTLRSQRASVMAQVQSAQPAKKQSKESGIRAGHRGQENTPEFKFWFGSSVAIDHNGNPLRLYHGTPSDFSTFDISRGEVTSDWGRGIYMTNNPKDSSFNYAGVGPDMAIKIEARVDELIDQRNFRDDGTVIHPYGSPGYMKMVEKLRREVQNHMAPTKGITMPLYARIERPVIVGGPSETQFFSGMEGGEQVVDGPGTLEDLLESIQIAADELGVFPDIIDWIARDYPEGISVSELREVLEHSSMVYNMEDENGKLIGPGAFLSRVFQLSGYDGIVDNTVDKKFGSQRRDGIPMRGMDPQTVHYIVFSNTQVKSYTGNDGSFDIEDGIVSSHIVGGAKNPNFRKWFKKSKVVDRNGKPKVVYHGTKSFNDFSVFRTHSSEMGSHFGTKAASGNFVDGYKIHLLDRLSVAPRVMPVYLSIQNPLRLEDHGSFSPEYVASQLMDKGMITDEVYSDVVADFYSDTVMPEEVTRKVQDLVKELGYDGIVYLNRREGLGEDALEGYSFSDINDMTDSEFLEEFPDAEDSWIVFDDWQIKSALSNTGEYSKEDGIISKHRQPNAASWHAPAITNPRWEKIVFNLQDKHIDSKKVVAAINESRGAPVPDQQDVYLQETLFHGAAAKMSEDFLNRELKPLLQDMALRKVTLDEFEKFLHNRHAKERNDQIARVNPNMPDGGSGIKTADALRYLNALPADKRTAYTALARRVDAMIARTNQLLVSENLESQSTIDNWNRVYKNYVPLHREDMGDGNVGGTGQGYTVKGPASKRATGSELPVENILANIAIAREKTITRGVKNRVATSLVNLALANRNPAFWDVDTPETIKFIGPAGIVVESIDPLWKNRPNVVVARMKDSNGRVVEHGVVFNKRNERAMRMAEALKNLSTPELSAAIGLIAKATRYFAAINTQYNPIFGVVNITRDAQQLMFNLTTTAIAGKQLAVAKNIIPALIGVYRDLRSSRQGRPARSAWAQTYEEFEKAGGQTGYRDLFVTPTERTENLIRELKHMDGGAKEAPRAVARWLGGWLSDYNTAMENATRLAAYKVARDSGVSIARSADIAKNLTVNFNRKGNVSSQVSALWAFFNASAQGTARLVETMRGPKGKMIIAGGILAGVLQAFALAAAGFDDDDPPDFVRQRSFIVPLGGKRYFTIPMPLGLNMLPNLGRVVTELVLTGGRNAADKTLGLATLIFDTFSPIGGGASVAQIASPTLFDPAVALLENKDWTGKPIERPDMNPLNPSPGHERAKERATPWGVWLSEGINQLTGGTEYTPGRLSPTPDAIDYVIGQVTGGVGREISKLAATLSAAATGEELPAHKIPLVGRFYGQSEGQTKEGDAFYRNVIEINKHEREIKGRAEAGKDVWDYIERNPTADLVKDGNKYERDVAKLRKARRELVKEGAPKAEVQAIEAEITDVMREFNDLVKEYRSR